MTEPGGIAPQPRPAQGDHTTGLAMVAAVLAALRMVERTGEGQVVDVSLMAHGGVDDGHRPGGRRSSTGARRASATGTT